MRHRDAIVRGSSVDNLALEIEEQADELFPRRTDDSMFKKLFSEIGELVENPCEDEWADVMIMLLDFGSRKKFGLELAIRRKMLVNQEKRTWVEVNGVYKHKDSQ
jgi:hypothetical protein